MTGALIAMAVVFGTYVLDDMTEKYPHEPVSNLFASVIVVCSVAAVGWLIERGADRLGELTP